MQRSKTITINVDEETETEFRKQAGLEYGRRKGYLGKAVTQAMKRWVKEKEANKAVAAALQLLKTGIKTKKRWKFNRDELYADRLPK